MAAKGITWKLLLVPRRWIAGQSHFQLNAASTQSFVRLINKDSREQFEMRTHKRLINIISNSKNGWRFDEIGIFQVVWTVGLNFNQILRNRSSEIEQSRAKINF